MKLVYSNNAQSTLMYAIAPDDTSIDIQVSDQNNFPEIDQSKSEWFPLTLIKSDGSGFEIVYCMARSKNTLTIVRARENTLEAMSFEAGDIVSHRMTSGAYDQFIQVGSRTIVVNGNVNIVTQSNNASTPYEVALTGLTELSDGLIITFKPEVENSSDSPSIKLNSLETKPVVYESDLHDDGILEGDIGTNRHYQFQYSQELDSWVMMSNINRLICDAGVDAKGAVKIGGLTTQTWLTSSDTETIEGCQSVYNRYGISRIVESHRKIFPITTAYLSEQWLHRGNSSTYMSADSGLTISGGYKDYFDFTLPEDKVLNIRQGTVVLRSRADITIQGDVRLQGCHDHTQNKLGPLGELDGIRYQIEGHVYPQRSPMGNASFDFDEVREAIRIGVPFHMFGGGCGTGKALTGSEKVVSGRCGLIMIAESIEITSSAKFHFPRRWSNLPDSDFFDGSLENTFGTTAGGAGLLILATPDLTISASSNFIVKEPDWSYEAYSSLYQNVDQNTGEYDADYGHMIHVNTDTGEIELLF